MSEFAVAAMGEDRPGIVAAVTDALSRIDASIEDSSMTILGGQFAMLLLVNVEESSRLEAALRPVADDLGLILEVRSTSAHSRGKDRDDYVIAAYGPDRPGLVSRLAQLLAREGVNITDFGSRVSETGVFAMWFNVTVPAGVVVSTLEGQLQAAGTELSLDVTVHRAEAEEL